MKRTGVAASNSLGERTATRIDSAIACKGWDSGPDSDYQRCVAAIKQANGGTLESKAVESHCAPEAC